MKKWIAALMVSCAASSHATSDFFVDAVVESVASSNTNGGLVVLRATDGRCRYYGALQQSARSPHGMAESVKAVANDGKVYDWTTVISYSACLQPDGSYVKERIALESPGAKRLRVGDRVQLRTSR